MSLLPDQLPSPLRETFYESPSDINLLIRNASTSKLTKVYRRALVLMPLE